MLCRVDPDYGNSVNFRFQAEPRREVLGPRAALLNQAMIESSSGGDDGSNSDGDLMGQLLNQQLLKGAKVAAPRASASLAGIPDVGERRRAPATSGGASLHAAHEDALAAWSQPPPPMFARMQASKKNYSRIVPPILLNESKSESKNESKNDTKARAVPTARKAEVHAALRQLCESSGCSQAVALHALLVQSGDAALAEC